MSNTITLLLLRQALFIVMEYASYTTAIIPEEKNDGRADTGWIIAVAVVVPVVIVVIIIISIICALVVLALKRQNKVVPDKVHT